jgi:hypothetical protein
VLGKHCRARSKFGLNAGREQCAEKSEPEIRRQEEEEVYDFFLFEISPSDF